MATNEIISKLNELAELRKMADDLNAEIEAIQNEIKDSFFRCFMWRSGRFSILARESNKLISNACPKKHDRNFGESESINYST